MEGIAEIRYAKRKTQFRFVLKGANGETVGTGESYTQKHNVTKTLKNYFPNFKIEDKTK